MTVNIDQRVAIVVDGNNLEKSIKKKYNNQLAHPNIDVIIPKLVQGRKLSSVSYYREGVVISKAFSKRLQEKFLGTTVACGKSADIPITIRCIELINRVDTIILISGDSDFIHLYRHLKSRGIRVEIAGYKESVSNKVYDEVDYYTHLGDEDMWVLNKEYTEEKQD
jgi:uncharacterized LabA/DUF88 family protein